MIEHKTRNFLLLLFMLILLGLFLIQLLGFGVADIQDGDQDNLPVSIRASSQADYSRDSDALLVQPVNESIFEQIIHDLQGTGDPQDRISTLQGSLSMPVPTMTVNPQMSTPILSSFTSTAIVFGSTTPAATASLPVTVTVVTPTPTATLIAPSPTPSLPASTAVPPATKKPRPTQRPRPTRRP